MKFSLLIALFAGSWAFAAPKSEPFKYVPVHVSIKDSQGKEVCQTDSKAPVYKDAWIVPNQNSLIEKCAIQFKDQSKATNIQVHATSGLYEEDGDKKTDYTVSVYGEDVSNKMGFSDATVYDQVTKKFSLETHVIVGSDIQAIVDVTFDGSQN